MQKLTVHVVATQIFLYVHPYLGKLYNLTHIFEIGLKPPTSDLSSGFMWQSDRSAEQSRSAMTGNSMHIKILLNNIQI